MYHVVRLDYVTFVVSVCPFSSFHASSQFRAELSEWLTRIATRISTKPSLSPSRTHTHIHKIYLPACLPWHRQVCDTNLCYRSKGQKKSAEVSKEKGITLEINSVSWFEYRDYLSWYQTYSVESVKVEYILKGVLVINPGIFCSTLYFVCPLIFNQ